MSRVHSTLPLFICSIFGLTLALTQLVSCKSSGSNQPQPVPSVSPSPIPTVLPTPTHDPNPTAQPDPCGSDLQLTSTSLRNPEEYEKVRNSVALGSITTSGEFGGQTLEFPKLACTRESILANSSTVLGGIAGLIAPVLTSSQDIIINSSVLKKVHLPQLATIRNLVIFGGPESPEMDISGLNKLDGDLRLSWISALKTSDSLTVGGDVHLQLMQSEKLGLPGKIIAAKSLKMVGDFSGQLDFSQLETLDGDVTIMGSEGLRIVKFPKLKTIGGSVILGHEQRHDLRAMGNSGNVTLVKLEWDAIESIGGDIVIKNNGIGSCSLFKLANELVRAKPLVLKGQVKAQFPFQDDCN